MENNYTIQTALLLAVGLTIDYGRVNLDIENTEKALKLANEGKLKDLKDLVDAIELAEGGD